MKAFYKTVFRSIKTNLSRLISVTIIILLGISFVGGLGSLSPTIRESFDTFLQESNISDLNVKTTNTQGFTDDEIAYFESLEKVDQVEAFTMLDLPLNNKETRIYVFDSINQINKLTLIEGRLPENDYEIVVERETKKIAPINLNTVISVMGYEFKVVGIVVNPLLFEETGEYSTNMQYLEAVYYTFSRPDILNLLPKTDLYITLENINNSLFSDEYQEYVKSVIKSFSDDYIYLTLEENRSYISLKTYCDKIEVITFIFPLFFILVSCLVVLTTITRMVEEERSIIACYKSLGISDAKIMGKYISYFVVSCLIATIFGLYIGVILLPGVIYPVFDVTYYLPPKSDYVYLLPGMSSFMLILFSALFVSILVLRHNLKEVPASLLNLKAPKAGKKIFLEKIHFIWKKLSFKYKSTLRNIFRYKANLVMTVLSVSGCTALVLAGLGIYSFSTNVNNPNMTGLSEALIPISVVIVCFALLLCIFVIYNLTSMNISERKREIATLKVLGYRNLEVTSYIYREILIMTIIGILFGIPMGCGLLSILFRYLEIGSLADVTWYNYFITFFLVLAFIFIVDLLLTKTILKIDMTNSLKEL